MNNDSEKHSLNLEAGDEISPRLESDYVAGMLSPEQTAAVEAALEDAPEFRARLRALRAKVAAITTPEKLDELANRLRREREELAPQQEAGRPSLSLGGMWRKLSTSLRELLDIAIPLPALGGAMCATPIASDTAAIIDFAFPPDGSMEISVISSELSDEGASLEVEISPLSPRQVQLVRRAPASFEVAGKIVVTAEERRQLTAGSKVSLRELHTA